PYKPISLPSLSRPSAAVGTEPPHHSPLNCFHRHLSQSSATSTSGRRSIPQFPAVIGELVTQPHPSRQPPSAILDHSTMWFSFWRSKNRFSLEELRYLTEQLQRVQVVNDVNKDFVVEALRSIAELVTYGDQHDSTFFDFFMEKQVMGEFVRLLQISRTAAVPLQLLQTVSIMVQNLTNEHAIYYLFSNEHINYLITYPFDFRNEELLSYYISFLRAISGKLDQTTISLLLKTEHNEVVAFPLYVEALKFAFHEETMIRIAVRALTLNVYHVGDDGVNRYITSGSLANYFPDLINFFRKQCNNLDKLVYKSSINPSQEMSSSISSAVDEIEDYLYYFSDIISAGIPDVGHLITDNLLRCLILPLLLPSVTNEGVNDVQIGFSTAMYSICCILRIVKIKDLANTIAAALFCPQEAFVQMPEHNSNGDLTTSKIQYPVSHQHSNHHTNLSTGNLVVALPDYTSLPNGSAGKSMTLRDFLLSYVRSGSNVQVLGSLNLMAVLLQTKELDESMLDAMGILPKRKQHKKLLLQSLVGESSGEEQLFSRDSSSGELDSYLRKLKEQYSITYSETEMQSSPRLCRFQVLDALVNLFCRSDVSIEALQNSAWLLRQLLPCSIAENNRKHLKALRDSYDRCSTGLLPEVRGTWADQIVSVLCEEWSKCKKVIDASSSQRDLKYLLMPPQSIVQEDGIPNDSSFTAAEKMRKLVKEFVLLYQLQLCFHGRMLPDQPPLQLAADIPENSRAKAIGLENVNPKPGIEVKLGDAVPCRIAFERGKERHFRFLAASLGTNGWMLLVEELPLKQSFGVIRMVAPLAGCDPIVDDKHPKWLHLRIRPSSLPSTDTLRSVAEGRAKGRPLVDGRWTLAFRDQDTCKTAHSIILQEMEFQRKEVGRRIKPLLDFNSCMDSSSSSLQTLSSSNLKDADFC
ncbi:hypothetical protein V2J09_011217, partial [Rumex salicifolius]